MATFYIKLLVLFFLCLGSFNSVFSQPIILKNDTEVYSLGSSLSYFIQNKNYTIEEVSNQNFDIKWLKNPTDHLNLGYIKNTVWLKVEIENKSKIEDWQIVLDMPFTDNIIFYQPAQNSSKDSFNWKTTQTGGLFNYSSRGEVKHSGFVFPLLLSANQKQTFYFKVHSNYPMLLPIFIATKADIYESSQDKHIGYGIYFGILLVMFLYNFNIFFLTRDFNYLYYILTIFVTFLTFAGVSGYLFKYIYPFYPSINDWLVRASMSLTVVFTAIFAIYFLQLKTNFKWFYRFFLISIGIASSAFVINTLGYQGAVNSAIKIQTLLLLLVGIYCWIKGNKFARFFTLAWICYIIGGLLITLRNSGSLPINLWTNHGAEVGSALEVILISMALADRYKIINQEKEMATKKALQLEQQTNQELENKVKERTVKLNESNEELAQINEELSVTLEVMGQQKTEIESKNKDITDSINYAKRIQDAILPSQNTICRAFNDCFTLYLPKDVVSGDFYFLFENEKHTFLVVADCTGHGVPGSLMAMIGTNILRESIIEKQMVLPSQILMNLHQEIVTTLKQKETGNRDGMDISLCVINKAQNKIYFSGAKNTLIAIKNEEIIEYKGSRFSIGGSIKTEGISFEDEIIDIDSQTSYYMYSDGYQDQFGGKNNKKFMRKNLKDLLQSIHQLPFEEQKQILQNTIFDWQQIGNTSQIDDILVMGFKI